MGPARADHRGQQTALRWDDTDFSADREGNNAYGQSSGMRQHMGGTRYPTG